MIDPTYTYTPPPLTTRERFAAMALQGILANDRYDAPRRTKFDGMAEDAVAAADALIAALNKSPAEVNESGSPGGR